MKCLIAMLSCGKQRRWRIHRPPHSRWDLGIYQELELLILTICRSPVETAVVPGLVKCVCVFRCFQFLLSAFDFLGVAFSRGSLASLEVSLLFVCLNWV